MAGDNLPVVCSGEFGSDDKVLLLNLQELPRTTLASEHQPTMERIMVMAK